MRMVQAGDRLRLALEPPLQIGVRGDMLGEDLDGDRAIEARVMRFVDLAHPAGANGGDDLVGAEARTGADGHDLTATAAL